MKTILARYEITRADQEFHCHQCGYPLYVGDHAYEVQCEERESEYFVCSKACDDRDLKQWRTLNEQSESRGIL